jgi:hypothetical protein
LKKVYVNFPEVIQFLEIYESAIASEAGCERLFSFFKRMTSHGRESMEYETLESYAFIYQNKLLPILKLKIKEKKEAARDAIMPVLE